MTDELKPCPFCGEPGTAHLVNYADYVAEEYGCKPCMVSFRVPQQWNRRAGEASPAPQMPLED